MKARFHSLLGGEALHPLDQHAAVPGAVEDRDLPALRQAPPEAVEVVARLVLALRGADGIDDVAARIEFLGDALDGAAFAGRVPALETR